MSALKRTTLALALCTTVAAEASTDNFVEMQLSAAELGHAIRIRLATQTELCPHLVSCPSGQCFVDHVEMPTAGWWSKSGQTSATINSHTTLSTQRILYTQPVAVHLKEESCARTPGCQTTTQASATITVELKAGPNSSLCFDPEPISGLTFPINLSLQPFCMPMDIQAIKVMNNAPSTTITGEAISLASGGSRIGYRFELDRPQGAYDAARILAWSDFLSGQLAPGNSLQDWSLFTHKSLLEGAMNRLVDDALAANSDLVANNGPHTTWTGLGAAGGQLEMTMNAEYDGCLDIAPLTMATHTTLNATSNGLATAGSVNWGFSDLQAAWCGLLDGFIVGAIAAPIIANALSLKDLGTAYGDCLVTGDKTFVCGQTTHPQLLALGPGWTLKAFLDEVYGDSNGLYMAGGMTQLGAGPPDVQASLQEPTFGYKPGCNNAECGYLGGAYLHGNAKLCDVEFSNDPLNVFEVTPPSSLTLPARFDVRLRSGLTDTQKTAYLNYPAYGLYMTVLSSAGVHTYEFEPTELLPIGSNSFSDDESFLCLAWDIKDWARNCLQPKWRPGEQRFHPEWVIDPWDRAVLVIEDHYQVEIGLGLVERLQLTPVMDRTGRLVVGISLSGDAYVSVLDEPSSDAFNVSFGLGRYRSARSLEEAIELAFGRGLNAQINIEEDLLPAGIQSASFTLNLSQGELLELASARSRGASTGLRR